MGRSLRSLVAGLGLATLLAPAGQAAQKPKPKEAAPPGQVEQLADIGMTLTFPAAIEGLEAEKATEHMRSRWKAKLGASSLDVRLYLLPIEEFGYEEPEDVTEGLLDSFREQSDPTFAYQGTELVSGAYGFAPYGAVGWGEVHGTENAHAAGGYYALGGLLEEFGYALQLLAEPALDPAGHELVLGFLRGGIACKGKTRDAKWSDAEATARWDADAPPTVHGKLEKLVRTRHFIFLSNTSAAKQMGEAMEQFYAKIQKTYPFPEIAGRRLMPVFLFRDPDEYYDFYAKQFHAPREEAEQSKGVASGDFYSTYYDAPQDPVHIHEATHQIFQNRLRLGGGGSWFQEGVAEYLSTRPGERSTAASLVKHGRHTPLQQLIQIESLLGDGVDDKSGDDRALTNYELSALLIEFVRESKWSKDHFLDWMHAVGNCPDNNLPAIERATQATLGVDIAAFELKWIEYCKDR